MDSITRGFEPGFFAAMADAQDCMDKGVVRIAVGNVIAGPRLAPHADTAACKNAGFNAHIAQFGEQNIGADLVFDVGRIFDDHVRHRFLLQALRPTSPPLLWQMMPNQRANLQI